MGQSSIHTLNKTGYSMFWNSMWDNKISYTRMLKENIFLNKFFSLSLGDSLSSNIFDFKDKNIIFFKRKFQFVDVKKSSLYKHLYNVNKIKYYSTKLWVLRYQKWIILYHFVYIPNFNKKKSELINSNNLSYYNNSNNLFTFYKKVNKKIKFFYLKKNKTNIFSF